MKIGENATNVKNGQNVGKKMGQKFVPLGGQPDSRGAAAPPNGATGFSNIIIIARQNDSRGATDRPHLHQVRSPL